MDKKILNTDDNDKLNQGAAIRNYGTGKEEEHGMSDLEHDTGEEPADKDQKPLKPGAVPAEDELMPDELAFPEEQEDEDELP